MKINKEFSGRVRNVSEKDFFDFYFLKVNICLITHNPYLKLNKRIENIVIEGTVFQIFDRGPGSFSKKKEKNIQINI